MIQEKREDQGFQELCNTHSACILQTAFFIHESRPWWSLCVSYGPMEQQKPPSEIATKKEPPSFFEEGSHQKDTFEALKAWRKETAKEAGIPGYIICTDREPDLLTSSGPIAPICSWSRSATHEAFSS